MDSKFLNLKLQWKDDYEDRENFIEIGKASKYKLLSIEGIESSEYDINIEKYNQYDGGYINNKRIESRTISFIAEFTDLKMAEAARQNLIGFFNPRKTGILTVNHCGVKREIEYEIEGFKEKRSNLYEPLCFQVDLICPDPYFKSVEEINTQLGTWVNGLKFKFSVPFKLKERGDTKESIFNYGHVDTPIKVFFNGPAKNPLIRNKKGEFIRVNSTLTQDEILYINTAYGNKTVEILKNGGAGSKNAFNLIDLESTFFSLQPGDNEIEYYSDDDTLKKAEVSISYKNRYLGV